MRLKNTVTSFKCTTAPVDRRTVVVTAAAPQDAVPEDDLETDQYLEYDDVDAAEYADPPFDGKGTAAAAAVGCSSAAATAAACQLQQVLQQSFMHMPGCA